jgi:hypothetical protein
VRFDRFNPSFGITDIVPAFGCAKAPSADNVAIAKM